MVAELITLTKATMILKKPLDDLYELGKSEFKNKLDKWKIDRNIAGLHKKIESVQKVKTIWQIDKEVNLKSFYYPSKLIIDKESKIISNINQIPNETNAVIEGTVGQGKSIFLRYLCSQELRVGSKIPIFFELRKIQKEKKLKQHLIEILDSWGFEVTDDLFGFYAESGKFCLFLDGFDELDPLLINNIISELEFFSEKYPNLRIIITSRPDSGIDKSAYFRIYKLASLTKGDHEGILKKLISDEDQAQNILMAISGSSTEINELLTTPLMMTLLVLIYKAEQKIPEQFSDFYENLFQILLLRHDKSKPGYVRQRYCSINERRLQDIFETFCFLASKQSLTTMKSEIAHQLAESAISETKFECDASNFIKDISKVVCLFVEEGFDFHFIHKSVREYHAANFIKKRSDEFAVKFYSVMLNNEYLNWKQELSFLSQVDEYRFTKYFLIPHILQALAILDDQRNITDLYKLECLKDYQIGLNKNTMHVQHGYGHKTDIVSDNFLFSDNQSLTGLIINEIYKKSLNIDSYPAKKDIVKKIKEKAGLVNLFSDGESYQIGLLDLIEIFQFTEVLEILKEKRNILFSHYQERQNFLDNEDKKNDMLDF